ncbi:acyl-CoA dehydrogenase [Streptomyces sp. WAC05374]|uniref:acyl-CoA dehydrogenase family protein n=1 Tax=Streptomyces sp. WAC05374 TaxID=2487420 RepID=UPI000F882BEB|nr:acyl-CoA dehydrogenase family protein [Streptomyces sp. WAC05374]RST16356.1 acyl-CoA dehydrogenase [Streptomyces sp. WAC05374]TDF50161.1 acyl-CoA dehydrogenase [Streptomyces sp. WAC05374]TDF57886.1 acyl-CoA dehydrogenase [Streptomyces sp. WAC05374]TDF60415.1 acyl-CoA dehydrogenase [Streptomyces sp. WAC05374]
MSTRPRRPGGPDLTGALARVAEVTETHLARTDRDAAFPVEALDELRHTGLLGLLVPVEHGGLGGTVRDLVAAAQTLGRADMSVGMIFAMHCQQAAAVVRYADDQLRKELLPRIAAGEVYLASVTTEAGKGGHLLTARAPLEATADRLRIDRFAPIVTGGAHADGFLITMRGPGDSTETDVSLVYADREQLEVSGSGDWDPMGMRASHSVPLRLVGSVPGHHVVGERGQFREIAGKVFGPLAHVGWSAVWLGTAAGALSRVLELMRGPAGRDRFDTGSDLLLTRLSRVRQRLDTVHALLAHAVDVVESGEDLSRPSRQLLLNSLKITASEECAAAVDGLVELVGLRHGYLKDSPTRLELAVRDLRSAALNYSNDRLHLADGRLALLDRGVTFA